MDEKRCINCGKELSEEAEFCSECGTRIAKKIVTGTKMCPACNKEIDLNAIFCPKCGVNTNEIIKAEPKKKKKGMKWIVICLIFTLAITSLVIVNYMKQKKEDERREQIVTYIEQVDKIYKLINDASGDLGVIGSMYNVAVDIDGGGLLSQDVFVNYCTSLCASDIVNAKEIYDETKQLYNDITECKEDEVKELAVEFEELYDTYGEYHKFLIDHQFTVYNYKSTYAMKKSEFDDSKENVKSVLDVLIKEFPAVDTSIEKGGNNV